MKSTDPKAMISEWFGGFVTASVSPENYSLIVDEALKFDPEWIARLMRGIQPPIKRKLLRRALVMEGRQFFPEGNELSWCHYYPQASHWRYSGGGHFFFLEDPDPFNGRLRQFLLSADE